MTTVVVARRTGGDLATALEESAASLRETARLEALLRTKTAEGRGQVVVLAAAPFLLCGLIAWLEPTWFDATLHSSQGNVLLGGCACLWLVATLWAHRIVGVPL
jgi:tight adherence protein B